MLLKNSFISLGSFIRPSGGRVSRKSATLAAVANPIYRNLLTWVWSKPGGGTVGLITSVCPGINSNLFPEHNA